MHRALAVVEAVKATLIAANTNAGPNVYQARVANFELEELPAIDLVVAEDSPVSEFGADNNHYIDSILRVYVDLHDYTKEAEGKLLEQIFELRSQTHAALLADPELGETWIGAVRYQGAEVPEFQLGDVRVVSYRTAWDVWYRMPYANPEA